MSEIVEIFREFLSEFKLVDYSEMLYKLAYSNKKRIIFSIDHIRSFKRSMSQAILDDPSNIIPQLEEELYKITNMRIRFGLKGAFGEYTVNPRSINTMHLGHMVALEGIITSCSLVRPKVSKSVHYSEKKNVFFQKDYRDSTMITKLPPTNTSYPTKDVDGNLLMTEFGLSEYFDFQTATVQEMPERAPAGQLPRSIEIVLSEDLVDIIKPGDRIKAYGIYKCMNTGTTAVIPNQFKTFLVVNNIEKINNMKINPGMKDVEYFNILASKPNLFEIIKNSIAPSIYGSDDIKLALALMLVGGNEVIMENGSRIRGDINVLLIGDPSTAKSQLLRYVMGVSPLAVATTGRGSSGVGLTAAVVSDTETGDRRLEAGAMVLADRGIVCIDEFDKMSDGDRVAIHEVMEQQTVTIAKAGIHTTLNARCTVLAAANPILGQYKESLSPHDNVKLPESLLTRFDLIFITLDESSIELDRKISEHVLRNHTHQHESEEGDDTVERENSIFDEDGKTINQVLFRRFVAHCKILRPILTSEAANLITQAYVGLRQEKKKNQVVSVTPRMLETMIRLATAHAKLRMSERVEEEDAKAIIEILKKSLFKEIIKHHKKIKTEENMNNINNEIGVVYNNEKDKVTNHNNEIDNIDEMVLNALYSFREENPNAGVLNFKDFLVLLGGINEDLIRQALIKLEEQEIIIFRDELIIFL
ncbi:DNA replication licensing factor mcm3 [Astathelohania contejeani]|uniref:DNA replication licensing factor MCM3 n=1 Tax=Astathelohania contejeani TaxID=164912 RepID=A0ABQ7I0R1_9MICR|nr:DNA replication licensing factor mcm3 [Thelohania contejeani]